MLPVGLQGHPQSAGRSSENWLLPLAPPWDSVGLRGRSVSFWFSGIPPVFGRLELPLQPLKLSPVCTSQGP